MRWQKANHWSLRTHGDVYALVLGSAVGIGNILTLPVLVKEGGGLSILIIHFIGILLLGGSLLLAEFLWSRWLLRPYFESFQVFGPAYRVVPYLSMLAVIMVTPPYLFELGKLLAVFPGVIYSGGFTDFGFESTRGVGRIGVYLSSVGVLATALALLVRGPRYSVPVLRAILLTAVACLALVAMTILRHWGTDGLEMMVRWELAPFNAKAVFKTLIFSLFTVSAGFGIMYNFIFYASQRPVRAEGQPSFWQRRGALGRIVVTVVLLDFAASLLGIVFVSPFAISATPLFEKTSVDVVLFNWLPHILVRLPGGFYYVLALIVGLFLVGFAALLSLVDFAVFSLETELQWARPRAALHVMALGSLLLVLPLLPMFSTWMGFLGMNVFLPLGALGLSWMVGWKMSAEAQSRIFGKGLLLDRVLQLWRLLIRYAIPAFLVFYLLQQIGDRVWAF